MNAETRAVAALYVDRRGPYFDMLGVDPWDEERDATGYPGPHADPALALRAVDQVRAHGGVLEHPARSRLWPAKGMPYPGDLWQDAWGGWSLEVNQVSWGHPCEKRTWLYLVGLPTTISQEARRGGAPTHVVTTSRKKENPLPELTQKWRRKVTPPAFAEWLVSLARRSQKAGSAP